MFWYILIKVALISFQTYYIKLILQLNASVYLHDHLFYTLELWRCKNHPFDTTLLPFSIPQDSVSYTKLTQMLSKLLLMHFIIGLFLLNSFMKLKCFDKNIGIWYPNVQNYLIVLIYSTLDLSPLRKTHSYKLIEFKLMKFRITGLIWFIFIQEKGYGIRASKIHLY